MNEQSPARSPAVKRLVQNFAAVALLIVVYQGIRWGLRQYTTGLIEEVVGAELPDFAMVDLDGREFTKDGLRGKTVILNFFRSKCHNCREEAPGIVELAKELDPSRVVLLGIMVDRVQGFPAELTARTLAEFGFQHPVLMADDAFVDAFHGAGWSQITPVTYVVDPTGKIVRSFRHPYPLDDLRAALP